MKSDSRSVALDAAKFLAMYLVVFGHFLNECADNDAYLINFVHMPCMFFISGYLAFFSIEKQPAGNVLKKKIRTLLIPYIAWSGISLLANMAFSVLGGTFTPDKMWKEAVEIFLYARSVWFLIQLFVTFLVFLLVRWILQKIGKVKYELPVCGVIWLLLALYVPGDPFDFYKFKWLFPFWGAGYLIGGNHERLHGRYRIESAQSKSASCISSSSGPLARWAHKVAQGLPMKSGAMPLKRHPAANLAAGMKRNSYLFSCALTIIERAALLYPILAVIFYRKDRFLEYTRFDYHEMSSALYGVLYYMISMVGVVFLMILAHWISECPAGQICAEIGTYSMDIYVIHMFLIKMALILLDLRNMGHMQMYVVVALLSFAVILIIWRLVKRIFRRIRIYRLLVGASYP